MFVYAARNRPNWFPPGYTELKEHPDSRHGCAVYEQRLEDSVCDSFELIPTGDWHVQESVARAIEEIGPVAARYLALPQGNELLLERVRLFFATDRYSRKLCLSDWHKACCKVMAALGEN